MIHRLLDISINLGDLGEHWGEIRGNIEKIGPFQGIRCLPSTIEVVAFINGKDRNLADLLTEDARYNLAREIERDYELKSKATPDPMDLAKAYKEEKALNESGNC